MDDETEKKSFTWVLNDFSLQDDKCYSLPVMVAGCNWRLVAYPKGYMSAGYLCLFLELEDPASLHPLWRRRVNFTLTLVNMGLGKSNLVFGEAQCVFDTTDHNSWGYNELVSLTKLHDKDEGFLANDKLVIITDLVVFPPDLVKISVPLSTNQGNQASDAPAAQSQGESSCPMEQKTENASKESLDNHDISKEASDDDTTDESSNDDDGDDTSEETSDDDSSSSVSDDGARDKVESMIQMIKDMGVRFRPKNQNIREAYMVEFSNFLKTMCQPSVKLSEDDMNNANDTLVDLIDAGVEFSCIKTMLENDLSTLDFPIKDLPAFQSDAFVIGGCKCRLTKRKLDASEKSEKDGAESSNLLNEASDSSQGESSSQIEQKTENTSKESLADHDISEEGSDDDDTSDEGSDDHHEISKQGSDDDDDDDDDDGTSDESSDDDDVSEESSDDYDDDSSSSVSDDGARDKVELASSEDIAVGLTNQKITRAYIIELRNFFNKVCILPKKLFAEEDNMSNAYDTLVDLINVSVKFNCVEKMLNELSESDGAITNFPALQSDTFVIGACKCGLTKGNLNASERSKKDGAAESSKETIDVNGFQVLPSQEESVRRIFEKHPDIALEFRGKNQKLRKACMNFLLNLTETMCESLEELSTEDLVETDVALGYLKDAGFKVEWLEKKLEQVVEKKENEESSLAKLKETEESLLKLKQKCVELDALAEAHKILLSATRTPFSFDDLLF